MIRATDPDFLLVSVAAIGYWFAAWSFVGSLLIL